MSSLLRFPVERAPTPAVAASRIYLPQPLAAGGRTPPTFVSATSVDWSTTGTPKTTATVNWQTGDRILVVGGTSNVAAAITDVTNTGGLSLTPGTPSNVGSSCWANSWTATAGSDGSGTFTSTCSDGAFQHGITVYVWRGSDGFGTHVTAADTGKTVSLTRGQDESAVVTLVLDFDAGSAAGLAWTPAGQTQRFAQQVGGAYTVYLADWADQDTAGTTSYGISGTASTGVHTRLAVEVYGTSGGGALVSLTPAAVTLTAQPITAVPGAVTTTLTPATLTFTAVAVVPMVTVQLTPATITLTARPVTALPGPVSATLTVAALTLTARPIIPVPGPVSTPLTPATLTVAAVPLTPVPGPVTVTLSPATITFTAVTLTPVVPGVLSPAVLTLTAVSLVPVPGPVSAPLTAAQLTFTAVAVTPRPALLPATITLTARPLTPIPGAAAATLTPVVLAFVAAVLTPKAPYEPALVGVDSSTTTSNLDHSSRQPAEYGGSSTTTQVDP